MDASSGSASAVEPKSIFMTPAYTYWIWFLIGCLCHFGLQIFMLSNSIYTDVLEIPNRYCGTFLANMVALSIISCYVGYVCSHMFFPFNKIAIELSFIAACLSLIMLCFVNLIDKKFGKWLYVFSTAVGCFCFGVMESVGITSANDPGLQGRASKRVIFFLCGHPIGYFMVLLIHMLIENSWFTGYVNSCGYVGAVYSAYAILVCITLGVPTVLFIITYLYPLSLRAHGWQKTNVIDGLIYYGQALMLLNNYAHYIVILVVIEAAEMILNWRIVLFLHDPYPKFDSIICSLSIVMGYTLFDFIGRGFSIAIRRMVADLRDRRKIMVKISKKDEPEDSANSLDAIEKGVEKPVDEDPEVQNDLKLSLFKSFLVFTWLPISFRIITGLLMFVHRHYPENLALNNYTNLQGTIMLTMINAFIRGIIVNYVYSNLFDTSVSDYLKELDITVYSKPDEPRGCVDMRYNAKVIGSLVVSIVRYIDITVLMVLAYVFYKYNRLLFDVSEIFKSDKRWPTDNLSNDLSRFWWWVKRICALIWRDVRGPFELFGNK